MVTCPLCGFEFDPDCNVQTCQGCPVSKSCAQAACPRCGYTVLPEAKLISWLRALKARVAKKRVETA